MACKSFIFGKMSTLNICVISLFIMSIETSIILNVLKVMTVSSTEHF